MLKVSSRPDGSPPGTRMTTARFWPFLRLASAVGADVDFGDAGVLEAHVVLAVDRIGLVDDDAEARLQQHADRQHHEAQLALLLALQLEHLHADHRRLVGRRRRNRASSGRRPCRSSAPCRRASPTAAPARRDRPSTAAAAAAGRPADPGGGAAAAGAGAAGFAGAFCARAAPAPSARLNASAAAPRRVTGKLINRPFKPSEMIAAPVAASGAAERLAAPSASLRATI